MLRVTDFLAVLGLAISIVLTVRWLIQSSPEPATLCAGFFVVLALVLGAPSHMLDTFGFARPVSPLLLWIMIEAVCRKAWGVLAPPLLVSLSVSLVFLEPFVAVLRGMLGR